MSLLEGKRILITGGTGSLGKVLIRRILTGAHGTPRQIVVFSRDEAKQHFMRLEYQKRSVAVDDFLYRNFQALVSFKIGDVRDYHSTALALRDVDIVINAAALKQVPACEYFPAEAVATNVIGATNIVRAIQELALPVEHVVGVSTDKACLPVNVMGMTKALQERVFVNGNLDCPGTSFVCVRYGNVLASRGSIIPLFHEQIRGGGPVTLTTPEMTRFMLSLNDAVDLLLVALTDAQPGEIYVPRIQSLRVIDLAEILIDGRDIAIEEIGIRPGEKIHEILISTEESHHTVERGENHLVILPMLPELRSEVVGDHPFGRVFTSADSVVSKPEIYELLERYKLRIEDQLDLERDLLA